MSDRRGRRLTIGPTKANLSMMGAACTVAIPYTAITALLAIGSAGEGDAFVALLFSVITLATPWMLVSSSLRTYREAYWLHGSVLTQRRVRSDRRCDLAKAELDAGRTSSLFGPGEPFITAHDEGRSITVRLRYGRGRPPRRDLLALADAIAGGPEDDQATTAAKALRDLADDVFELRGSAALRRSGRPAP